MAGTITLPSGLVIAGAIWIGVTFVVALGLMLVCSPILIINRPKSAYWADWNDSQKAPWVFWHIGGFWYRFCELLGNYVLPAPQRVTDLASSFIRSQVIICFSELGVPEALAKGPKTGRQLAAELKVQQDYLERVLRVAERLKVVRATYIDRSRSVKQYHITQLSAVLCGGHVNSVKHMVGLFGDHFPAFAHLTEGVRTGQTPYKLYAKGQSHWEHMMAEPELYTRFNKAMTDFNHLCPIEAVFREYSFKPFSRVIDVGGGLGAFTAACMQVVPDIKGHLFDLPHVIKQAQQVWSSDHSQLLSRMSFSAGSFFDASNIPPATSNTDLYALRQILHDWSDADSLRILKQVRAAIGNFRGAKLIIVEACIASQLMTSTHTPRLVGDVHMLVQYGDAQERSEQQFSELLTAAGFTLNRILPTKSLFFVLEASPV